MRLFSLFITGLLFVAAISLASALVTRDGVGAIEYIVGFALVIALLALAFARSRRLLLTR
jgi:hypothetical protein